jgi:hypothetical protein
VHNTINAGDKIEIVKPIYDIIKARINKLIDLETGNELKEAHGGGGLIVIIESEVDLPEYSVLRRKK